MGERAPGEPPSATPPDDWLDSWKDIATYLNRDVTTVQRWEKREGMPVHRHLHGRMGSVYAFRADLDAWVRSRSPRAAQENGSAVPLPAAPAQPPGSAPSTSPARWKLVLPLAAAGAALAIGAGLWLQRTEFFWRSPLANARFQVVTDFDGVEQAAAVSRDGRFVAFLSDRDGRMDVWPGSSAEVVPGGSQGGSGKEAPVPECRRPAARPRGSVRKQARGPEGGSEGFSLDPDQ